MPPKAFQVWMAQKFVLLVHALREPGYERILILSFWRIFA